MRATGIVRRIDDLGRIVIPKEIRRRLNIRDGDPLELYLDGEAVVFKKYDYLENARQAVENTLQRIDNDYDLPQSLSRSVRDKLNEALKLLKESEEAK